MKADNGFQDNYSVVVASGTWITDCPPSFPPPSNVSSATPSASRDTLLSSHTFSWAFLSHTFARLLPGLTGHQLSFTASHFHQFCD